MLPLLLARVELPITSVMVANTVWEATPVALVTEKLVCRVPTAPTSRAIFWMGQVEKKSRTGDWLYVGC